MILKKTIRKLVYLYDKLYRNLVKHFWLRLSLWYHSVRVEGRVRINGVPFIINKGFFCIGDGVVLNSRYKNNPIGGANRCSFWIKQNAKIIINSGAKISNSAFVSTLEINIGANVYIGGDCKFYDTDFHSLSYYNRAKLDDPDVKSAPIIIGENVFIGGGTVVLKGVHIGENSVIGAGSVVTKHIPTNQIWAGNPAKFIKCL